MRRTVDQGVLFPTAGRWWSALCLSSFVLTCGPREGARLWEIQASSIPQDAVAVTRMSVMPGVDAAVPESNPKGCYVENLDLRRPVTGPFTMPRLISNVAWFAERLGPAVSGGGLT